MFHIITAILDWLLRQSFPHNLTWQNQEIILNFLAYLSKIVMVGFLYPLKRNQFRLNINH